MVFTDYESGVTSRLKDTVAKLSQADQDAAITQAVKRYSKDRPRELVTDVPGKGTAFIDLPSIAAVQNVSNAVKFEDGFSEIESIEFPIGDAPPTLLEDFEWQMYRTPTGLQIMLTAETPATTDTLRVTWTARHDQGTSGSNAIPTTVPDADFEAVCDLAASFSFDILAAAYARTSDSSIGADAVNYRTKSQEAASLATKFRKRYEDHLGIEGGGGASAGSGSPTPGAIAIGDMDLLQGSGVDRLTHRRPR